MTAVLAAGVGKIGEYGTSAPPEAGPAVDMDLVQADAVSFRMPYQGEKACRDAINQGKIDFTDVHLSHCSQQLVQGFFGKIDFAVIEASDISDDGRVYFTTAIGVNREGRDRDQPPPPDAHPGIQRYTLRAVATAQRLLHVPSKRQH